MCFVIAHIVSGTRINLYKSNNHQNQFSGEQKTPIRCDGAKRRLRISSEYTDGTWRLATGTRQSTNGYTKRLFQFTRTSTIIAPSKVKYSITIVTFVCLFKLKMKLNLFMYPNWW